MIESKQLLQAVIVTVAFLLIGWLALQIALYSTQLYMKKQYSIRSIFRDFGQKMWMTIGLGILFFGFYFSLIVFGSLSIDSKTKISLFKEVYKNPSNFIYLGLLIFALISMSIYLVRLVIKYLYNTRNR